MTPDICRGWDRSYLLPPVAFTSQTVGGTVAPLTDRGICDLAEDLWRRAMEKMGTRGRFFENLRSITAFLIFPTWDDLLTTLAFARPPPNAL
jgi:hypothetical protein